MTDNTFYADFNVTGSDRKRLVKAVSEYSGADAKYLGAPSFAYQVDYFTIDRNGVLSFDSGADSEEIEGLFEILADQGFVSQVSSIGCEEEPETEAPEVSGVEIRMPKSLFTEAVLENLRRIIEAKGALIKKALGADDLPIADEGDTVCFPWFPSGSGADEIKAYVHLVSALCEMAQNQKRVTAKEKKVENDKYAFRCFLLRLGFIGAEYKDERKILLRNLTGSSAFKSGAPRPVTAAESEVEE